MDPIFMPAELLAIVAIACAAAIALATLSVIWHIAVTARLRSRVDDIDARLARLHTDMTDKLDKQTHAIATLDKRIGRDDAA